MVGSPSVTTITLPARCGESGRTVLLIREAEPDGIDAIKRLADMHRREVGFVVRTSLVDACHRGELLVAIEHQQNRQVAGLTPSGLLYTVVGFVQGYFRKDGQTTLHALVVDKPYRRYGVGRALVLALMGASRQRGMRRILLRCPIDLEANSFYAAIGFHNERIEQGKRRQLKVWVSDVPA